MNRLYAFVFSLLILASFARAQQGVYGLIAKSSPASSSLGIINPATGLVTNISTVSTAPYFQVGTSMIHPVSNRYYFSQPGNSLTAVDMSSGNVVSVVTMTNNSAGQFSQHVFNCRDSVTYGIAHSSSPAAVYIGSINLVTGYVTNISASIGSGFQSGCGTIDTRNNIYYLTIGPGNNFVGVSLATGSVLSNVTATYPGMTTFSYYKYNCADSSIYGIATFSSPASVYLAKINPQTGSVSLVSPTAPANAIAMGKTTLDWINQVFYMENGTGSILGISIANGSVVSNQSVSISYGNNFNNYDFTPACCYHGFEGLVGLTEYFSGKISVFPNPAGSEIFIKSANNNLHIQVFNILGYLVHEADYSGNEIRISTARLNSGSYFLKMSHGKSSCTKKVIIQH